MSKTVSVAAALATIFVCMAFVHEAAADCGESIAMAESKYGIPKQLLMAIGIEESGLDRYAVNADGVPYHPSSLPEATSLVQRLVSTGAKYIDVGCMQIDLHYHPEAFNTLNIAFDPDANVEYGAKYLTSNREQTGNWRKAVAIYHSGEPDEQSLYLEKITRRLRLLTGQPAGAIPKPIVRIDHPKPIQVKESRLSFMTVVREVDPEDDSYVLSNSKWRE